MCLLTLARACRLTRVWSEERSTALIELRGEYSQSVNRKKNSSDAVKLGCDLRQV